MITKTYHIGGMSCAACAASIEKRTMRLDGTAESSVNLVAEKLTITYDESKLSEQDIISAVEKLEFTIKPFEEVSTASAVEEDSGTKTGLVLSCIFAALLLYISMGQMLIKDLPVPSIVNMHMHPFGFAISQMILALAIMVIGRKKFVSGFKSLFHGNPNMDTLVALSCGCAFIYSLVMTVLMTKNPENVHNLYFESCGVVLTFISLGKYLESRSKEKTKDAITGLMNLAPIKALLIKDGNPVEVDASEIKIGDVVLVLSGARVPCDGIVIDGEAELDESAFTGESLPVHKDFGASVICGSVNTSGSIYVEVRKVGKTRGDVEAKSASIAAGVERANALYEAHEETPAYHFEVIAPAPVDTADIAAYRQAIVDYAASYVGWLPYVWGGNSLESGADCSGFVQAIYAEFGISIPRTCEDQLYCGTPVSLDDMRPGDIINYGGHVALYAGDGTVIHEPVPGDVCSYQSAYMMPIYGVVRIIN